MDIRCSNGNCSFAVRSAGVAIKDGKVLVQREKNGDEYAFPGGTLKFGETTEECLIREWKEEAGADIEVQRLLWVEESFWEYKGKANQSIAFYYLINLRGADIAGGAACFPHRDNDNVLLEWMVLEKISSIILYPDFANKELFSIGESVKHFIRR